MGLQASRSIVGKGSASGPKPWFESLFFLTLSKCFFSLLPLLTLLSGGSWWGLWDVWRVMCLRAHSVWAVGFLLSPHGRTGTIFPQDRSRWGSQAPCGGSRASIRVSGPPRPLPRAPGTCWASAFPASPEFSNPLGAAALAGIGCLRGAAPPSRVPLQPSPQPPRGVWDLARWPHLFPIWPCVRSPPPPQGCGYRGGLGLDFSHSSSQTPTGLAAGGKLLCACTPPPPRGLCV